VLGRAEPTWRNSDRSAGLKEEDGALAGISYSPPPPPLLSPPTPALLLASCTEYSISYELMIPLVAIVVSLCVVSF
jgi:hypothetical protein